MATTKTDELRYRDLPAAFVVDDDAEADFFIRGLREDARTAEKAADRCARVAARIRRAG